MNEQFNYEKHCGFPKKIWDINDLIKDKEVKENEHKIHKVRK